MNIFKYKTEHGFTIEKGTSGAAGWDIKAAQDVTMFAGERAVVGTGISMEIPSNFWVEVKSRSGLAAKKGVTVLCGVIDSDYRGEIKVVLFNSSAEKVEIKAGDRIAQLVPMLLPNVKLDVTTEDLSYTSRGEKGFGSTDKKTSQEQTV